MKESWLLDSNGDDLSIENGIERIRSRNSELEKQQALLYRVQTTIERAPKVDTLTQQMKRVREEEGTFKKVNNFYLRIWR